MMQHEHIRFWQIYPRTTPLCFTFAMPRPDKHLVNTPVPHTPAIIPFRVEVQNLCGSSPSYSPCRSQALSSPTLYFRHARYHDCSTPALLTSSATNRSSRTPVITPHSFPLVLFILLISAGAYSPDINVAPFLSLSFPLFLLCLRCSVPPAHVETHFTSHL